MEKPIQLDEFSFQLGTEVVNVDLNDYVPIDPDHLTQEFARQPSSYAYLATVAAQIEACYIDTKRAKDSCYAETDSAVRGMLAARGEKATEAGVKALIEQSETYRAAVDNETYYHSQYLIIKAIVTAMEQRAQMLISLGAHMRMEAGMTDMQIRDVRATLDAIKAGKAA